MTTERSIGRAAGDDGPIAALPGPGHHLAMKTPRRMPRAIVALLGTFALVAALGPTGATGSAAPADAPAAAPVPASVAPAAAPAVKLALAVSGLSSPVLVTNAADGSDRLFVVEQGGRIRVIRNGVLLPTPFLDIHTKVSHGAEQGLLGLAFHPDFKHNGKFYIDFTKADGATAIDEYHVSSDPDRANAATAHRILTIGQPYANHNGGGIAFGKDGYLYIGMGDGGGAGDPGNRARNINSLLGKMLRIDINGKSGGRQYRIPASNPYVGRPGRDEIWSIGLRNPWRWSFDRVKGDLWIGDVGQSRYEEIDRASVTQAKKLGRGADYGWRVVEGLKCYKPSSGCSTGGKAKPLVVYSHKQGCSVVGGYVYRGSAIPALAARYVFGDFCSGSIWSIPRTAAAPATKVLLKSTSLSISSFGEDEHGELYVVDLAGGAIYRFEAP